MKNLTLFVVYLLFSFIGFSQDIIHKKNGTKIKAKIIEIGTDKIKYKRFDFQDGPDYTILKKETDYIEYENGKKDVFFKNLSGEEYQRLCEKKVKHFAKQQKIGMAMAGVGLAGAVLIGINNYNYNMNSSYNPNQQSLYDFGYTLCIGSIAGGTVLFLTGRYKAKQYSDKLSKFFLGFNHSDNMKGFTLIYKF